MTKLAVYSMLSLLILPFIGKVPPETDYGGTKRHFRKEVPFCAAGHFEYSK